MTKFSLTISCAFGLESLLKQELKNLNIWIDRVENGRINCTGDFLDIHKANLWLRTADRVHINLSQFPATTWDQLFDGIYAIDWSSHLPQNAYFPINPSSAKSILYSGKTIQSITQKAIFKKLQHQYQIENFSQDGPQYEVFLRLEKDICTVLLNTTGPSLHKRGYRKHQTAAPIKETLAAALVLLSDWDQSSPLLDPFCGSGTIPIEAALIAKNIPPGINRSFAYLSWPNIPRQSIIDNFQQTRANLNYSHPTTIYASDFDPRAIKIAEANAQKAGLSDINFQIEHALELPFSSFHNYTIITNPPYGDRLQDQQAVAKLYRQLGQQFRLTQQSTLHIITSLEKFQETIGLKAAKKRKLYNGRTQCHFYSIPSDAQPAINQT